ncbi:MAG: hypothetical protein HUU37_01780 [Bdellovibrionales bacterium]|nr:hypothetical protein [Bdellovibrionales bacterium]
MKLVLAVLLCVSGSAMALPVSRGMVARDMLHSGNREGISIRAIPAGVKKHVFEVEHEDGCFMESASAIFLGNPSKLTGYEVVIRCEDAPYSHMAIYYDEAGNYLDTLTPGVD